MRRFCTALRECAVVAAAVACVIAVMVLFAAPVFRAGESYTLYLGGSSSALAVETEHPLQDKTLFQNVAGESTVYDGNFYREIKERFHATLLFTEEVCGVTNYYLYSGQLCGGVYLNGERVNLHIAVSAEQTAVGSPLIFGGF